MDKKTTIIRIKTIVKRVMRVAAMPILLPITWKNKIVEPSTFPHILSVVAIAKDEGPYIREWVEFYKVIGTSHIHMR